MRWKPIEDAPKDDTPVFLKRGREDDIEDKFLLNYERVVYGRGNVFYQPIYGGICVVRDATHFMLMSDLD